MKMLLSCLLLFMLSAAFAEIQPLITEEAKAGETISIPVIDKDPENSNPTICEFDEPYEGTTLTPTTTPSDGGLVAAGQRENGWTFELTGSNTNDCGIKITQVDKNDHGEWDYRVTGDDSGKINLIVQVIPTGDDIYFFGDADGPEINHLDVEIDSVEMGEEVDIYCIIEGIRPKPDDSDVTLEITGSKSLNVTLENVDYPAIEQGTWEEGDVVYRAKFIYYPEEDHDGEILTCVVDIDDVGEIVGQPLNLTVAAPPCGDCASTTGEDDAELGEDWTIKVTFPSNPEPTSAEWYIPALGANTLLDAMEGADIGTNDRATDAITSSGRYSTSKLTRNGESNDFSTSLTIEELEEDDENAQFTLMLENDLGKSNVTVSIRSFKDEGLSSGAIAGIVCGCVAFVVIVVIIIFFAVKKYKSKKARRSQQERIDRARVHYEQRHEYEQKEQQEREQQHQREGGSDNLGAVFYGANAEGEVSTEC